jgi:hypothetical protein
MKWLPTAIIAAACGALALGETSGLERDATRPLPFLYDLYTFRGEGGTEVVAAFAVEAGELERESVPGGVRYRFDVSLILTDTLLRSVIGRHDSVYLDLPRPLPGDHLLFTTVQVLAPPSGTTLQRVYMYNATAPGIGQLYMEPFVIPDYSGGHLMLSDIALAQPDATGGWRRGTMALALLPGRRFAGSVFEAYYEIYNLPRGHEYRTDVVIHEAPGDGDVAGRRLVQLSFAGEGKAAARGTVQEIRRVETSLARGRYRMTVTVTDLVSGDTASASRIFEAHARGRGATLVPALPVTISTPGR